MIMITGGAFQGKTEFVKKQFSVDENDIVDCGNCDLNDLKNEKNISHYELAVKRMIENNIDPLEFTRELKCDIVIINEIGCGIIPLDRKEREWREMTGRAGCILAEKAEIVYRVCCGIASIIKGEKH